MSTEAYESMADAAWARILPFLRPIEALILDPDISDIMVTGERGIFFEKDGRMEQAPGVTIREQYLQVAARNIARALGDEVSDENPILDSRLPDGSRVAVSWPRSQSLARFLRSANSRTSAAPPRSLCVLARSRLKY